MIPVDVEAPYALELKVVTETRIPIAGWRRVETRSYASVRFEEREGGWVQVQSPCAVEVDGGRVSFPDRFVDSLPDQVVPVTWRADGSYTAEPDPAFVGVRGPLAALPTDPLDPRVYDQDSDGQPGVTVNLDLPFFGHVHIHMVQAAHNRYVGKADADGIEGAIEVLRLDQETLSANVGMFAHTLPTRLVDGASSFRLVPDPEQRCRTAFD